MTTETLSKKTKFLVDQNGKRTHAVLPLADYEEILSDIYGLAVTIARRGEGSISIDEMKKRLREEPEVSS